MRGRVVKLILSVSGLGLSNPQRILQKYKHRVNIDFPLKFYKIYPPK